MGTFIGTKKSEVSTSWLDYWSLGHFLFGAVAFFITYAIAYFVIYPLREHWFIGDPQLDAMYWGLGVAIIAGILWEPIENIGLVKLGAKSKCDSWPNLICDVIMVTIGAVVLFFIQTPWINLIICIIAVVCMIVAGYYTNQNP
jgi:hypothetical protein